jgi:hypothetical protein
MELPTTQHALANLQGSPSSASMPDLAPCLRHPVCAWYDAMRNLSGLYSLSIVGSFA